MKKLLCYLGIIILFSLAVFPVVLRIMLPDKNKEDKEIIVSSNILSCQNDVLIVKGSYENEKVKMIVMKKILVEEEKNVSNNLITIFDNLKNKNDIIYKKREDGDVISIDFSISEHKDLGISNLTQDLQDQKLYYENQGLKCNIT